MQWQGSKLCVEKGTDGKQAPCSSVLSSHIFYFFIFLFSEVSQDLLFNTGTKDVVLLTLGTVWVPTEASRVMLGKPYRII